MRFSQEWRTSSRDGGLFFNLTDLERHQEVKYALLKKERAYY